jgi:hypothetical protein
MSNRVDSSAGFAELRTSNASVGWMWPSMADGVPKNAPSMPDGVESLMPFYEPWSPSVNCKAGRVFAFVPVVHRGVEGAASGRC